MEESNNIWKPQSSNANETSTPEVITISATAPINADVNGLQGPTTATSAATAQTVTDVSTNIPLSHGTGLNGTGVYPIGVSFTHIQTNPMHFPHTMPTYVNTSTTTYGQPFMPINSQPVLTSTLFGNLPSYGVNNYATPFSVPSTSRWYPHVQPNLGTTYFTCMYGQNCQQSSLNNNLPSTIQPPPAPTANNEESQTNPFTNNVFLESVLSPSQVASRQVITKDLPYFSGNPEEWPLFITNYEQSTVRCGFSNQENLIRLQKCLKGAALEAVRGKLMMPPTVPFAIETLRMLFGRPDIIHESLQRKLRQLAPVRSDQLETLIDFALAVQNYRATMQAIGLNDYLNDPMLLNELLSKLPGEMKLDWGRRRIEVSRVDIVIFDEWLYNLATCASQVTPLSSMSAFDVEQKSNRKKYKERVLLNEAETTTNATSCVKCSGRHRLQECPEFINLNRQDRWKFIKDNRLCIRCFKNHWIRRCNSKRACGVDDCKMAHNPLLHTLKSPISEVKSIASTSSTTTSNSDQPQNSNVLFHSKDRRNILFRYIPVTLYGNGISIKTLALVDEGSSISLIDTTLADKLHLDGPSEELCMKWTGDITRNEQNSKHVSLNISSQQQNSVLYKLRRVRTITNLDLPKQSLDINTLTDRPHLKSLPIHPYDASKALILIGLDNAKLVTPLEVREKDNDGLIATRCRLGWSVYGKDTTSGLISPERVMHLCDCNQDTRLDEMMRYYFSIESVGISPTVKPLLSKEDERSLQIMKSTTKYLESEKRWETGLLWKYEKITLPNSFSMALKRLECLERKLKNNPELMQFMTSKISDYLSKGYIKMLQPNEILPNDKSWYLPMFVVKNVNKNKMRIVWDAAAKVQNVALNNVLLKGPDLLRPLVGVIIRFRERPVALCGDIREMYHQVRIIKEDIVSQKFLWRNCEVTREPDVYAMTVMTFGACCSPSLANYVKNKNAERFEADYPQAVSAIKKNTFVDDWLQSADTEPEMMLLSQNVKRIHAEGGFEMRNWISNSKKVLKSLNSNSLPSTKYISDPDSQYEKVLGLWWLPESDELTFIHKFQDEVFDRLSYPTKRQILRILMTIFDPLGLLGFLIVEAKIILQDVWRSGTSWDEPIHDNERNAWWLWIKKNKKYQQN